MVQKREQQAKDQFDPLGSIFLPKTDYPDREFGSWEAAILMRRGILFSGTTSGTDSFEYQQRLHDEFIKVRSWYMGQLATGLSSVA